MRRFELGGTLWWEIQRDRARVVTRFGEVGKAPREVVWERADAASAAEAEAAVVAHRLAQGFVEVDAATLGGRVLSRDRSLEERLYDYPADLDLWRVYADFLLQRGTGVDLAELVGIEVRIAAGDAKRDPAVLERRHHLFHAVYGDLPSEDRATGRRDVGFTTRFGFLDVLSGDTLPESPDCWRFLREVYAMPHPDGTGLSEMMATLRGHPPEGLRRFEVDVHWPDALELSWTECGRFDLFEVCPRLEHVRLVGNGIELGSVVAPRLRSLVLETTGLPARALQEIRAGQLPALRKLEVWTGVGWRVQGTAVAGLEHVLGLLELDVPALEHLGICNCPFVDALVPHLVQSALVKRLKRLDLSFGTLTDTGARVLIEHAGALGPLAVDARDCFLSEPVQDALLAAFPGSDVTSQRDAPAEEDDVYVSFSE